MTSNKYLITYLSKSKYTGEPEIHREKSEEFKASDESEAIEMFRLKRGKELQIKGVIRVK